MEQHPIKFPTRIRLGDFGHAKYDGAAMVQLGDRLVPRSIAVHFPSAPDLPALDMTIEVRNDIPVCTQITVHAKDDGREVRDVDLRAIRIDDWIEDIVAVASSKIVSEDGAAVIEAVVYGDERDNRERSAARAMVRAARKDGRRRVTDDLLRDVAETYRANIPNGRPLQAVQRKFQVSYRTAARYVERARASKFLPEVSPGERKA